MRKLRKRIYDLQNTESKLGQAALYGVLSGYRLIDRVFLRRGQHLDRRSEKLRSAQRKFLCVIVPKCGSRTLIAGLQKAAKSENFDVSIDERDISNFQSGYDDSYKFAFVRNPWARAYSCYVQKVKETSPIKQALHYNGRPGLHADMTFTDFVEWLCGPHGGDDIADRHWASQSLILGLDIGISYDFIGNLETMDDQLGTICEKLDLPPDTFSERRNTTGQHADSYLAHYDGRLLDLIAQRYADDISRFGYTPPTLTQATA